MHPSMTTGNVADKESVKSSTSVSPRGSLGCRMSSATLRNDVQRPLIAPRVRLDRAGAQRGSRDATRVVNMPPERCLLLCS